MELSEFQAKFLLGTFIVYPYCVSLLGTVIAPYRSLATFTGAGA